MTDTIIKYTKYNVACLRVLGLWTEEDRTFGTKYYWMYHVFVNVLCAGLFILGQFFYMISVIGDFEEFFASTNTLLTCATISLKTYYYCKHLPLLKSILSRLDQEAFQPKNDRQRRNVHDFMRIHVNFQVLFFVCFCTAWPFYILAPVLFFKETTLPFKVWYPFDEKYNLSVFVLCYIHQALAMAFLALTNVAVDLVSVGLIAYVTVECDILSDILKHIHEFTRKQLEFKGAEGVQGFKMREEMNGTLLSCVRFHWKILKLSKDVNKIFNFYLFILFVNSLVAICLTTFQMTVVGFRRTELVILGLYLGFIFSDLLMYCWFGNQLIAKSDKINRALYESDWVDCPEAFKKNLAFFMLRTSQRPITMLGLDFFALSLKTFTSILKASWSFFAMLNQLRRKNM